MTSSDGDQKLAEYLKHSEKSPLNDTSQKSKEADEVVEKTLQSW